MPADGFNLRMSLPCFHIVTERIEANVAHITLRPVTRFLQSTHFSGVCAISSAEKRACAKKLRTLSINYTQLGIKVKFFFKKGWLFQKIVVYNADFQIHTIKISVESAADEV